jgi:hypothetical protein
MEKLLEARVIEFQKLLVVTNCSFLCANDKKKIFQRSKRNWKLKEMDRNSAQAPGEILGRREQHHLHKLHPC